jgi:hypothetical protein
MRYRGNIVFTSLARKRMILPNPIKPTRIDSRSIAIRIVFEHLNKWKILSYSEKLQFWRKHNLGRIHENTIWIENKKFTIVSTNDTESYQYYKWIYFNDDGTLNNYSVDYGKEEEIELLKPLAKNFHSWRKKSFNERLTIWKNNDFLKLYEHSISIEGHTENIFTIFPTNDEEIVKYFDFILTEYVQPRLKEKIEQFQLSLDNIVSSLHLKNIDKEIGKILEYLPVKNKRLNSFFYIGFKLSDDGELRPPFIPLNTNYFNYYFFNGIVLNKYYQFLDNLKHELKEGKPTTKTEKEEKILKNYKLRYEFLKKLGFESLTLFKDKTEKGKIIAAILNIDIRNGNKIANNEERLTEKEKKLVEDFFNSLKTIK